MTDAPSDAICPSFGLCYVIFRTNDRKIYSRFLNVLFLVLILLLIFLRNIDCRNDCFVSF